MAELEPVELELLALIDAKYTRHPFYGSSKMMVYLGQLGHRVNRKRVQRLMGVLGLAGHGTGAGHQPPAPPTQGLSLRKKTAPKGGLSLQSVRWLKPNHYATLRRENPKTPAKAGSTKSSVAGSGVGVTDTLSMKLPAPVEL